MKLEEAEKLAQGLLREFGLVNSKFLNPYTSETIELKGWRFKFDNAKIRFGQCNYRNKTISLSRHLTLINDRDKVEDTIRHEIAHAIVGGGVGHGNIWKSQAIACGAKPERCYGNETLNVKGKYVYKCPNCNKKFYKHRKIRRELACTDCCKKYNRGRFSRKFRFEYLGIMNNDVDITDNLMKIIKINKER